MRGGYFDDSFIGTYPVGEEGSPLTAGIVMPNNSEGVYYAEDPTYFNASNGNLFTYDIELTSAPPYEGYYLATASFDNLVAFEPYKNLQGSTRLVCNVVNLVLSCSFPDGPGNFWGCVDPAGEIIPTLGIWPPSVTQPGVDIGLDCYPITTMAVVYP